MIIYSATKERFIIDQPNIHEILQSAVLENLGEQVHDNDVLSWKNSLAYMRQIIDDVDIPSEAGIVVEYNIPVSQNRIDFIITGLDDHDVKHSILIELKQWETVLTTDMDAVVQTYYEGHELRDVAHPSYQVITYASLLYDYKVPIQNREIWQHPCAYLHNHTDNNTITHPFYSAYTKSAPVFCKGDERKLIDFIKRYIRKGDRGKTIYEIEDGEIRPAKPLADSISKMVKGYHEYKMIDTQKVVYEKALKALREYDLNQQKQVIIVEGGPGTGKSVIAVQLLAEVTRLRRLAHYITKNAAPRNVFTKVFTSQGVPRTSQALFKSSVVYAQAQSNEFDMLIADEAHRLSDSNPFGKNTDQVEDIIKAAKVSIFFVDENQIVSLQDRGSIESISTIAVKYGANIEHEKLVAQFRCGGSDEYLKWLDSLLQLNDEPIRYLTEDSYPLKIVDNPNDLRNIIIEKNRLNNKSRMVAGFCWAWANDQYTNDITIPQWDFHAKWNLRSDKTWAISDGSVDQIGCIHTCQGLEFDYCGVIIGLDMVYRDGKVLVDPSKRAKDDFSIKGYRELLSSDEGKEKVRLIIKNTYRTLLTRGMKGCYVYIMDDALRNYFKSRLK